MNVGRVSGAAAGASYEVEAGTNAAKDPDGNAQVQFIRIKEAFDYVSVVEVANGSSASPQALQGSRTAFLRSWTLPKPTYVGIRLASAQPRMQEILEIMTAKRSVIWNLMITAVAQTPSSKQAFVIADDAVGNITFTDERSQVLRGIPNQRSVSDRPSRFRSYSPDGLQW